MKVDAASALAALAKTAKINRISSASLGAKLEVARQRLDEETTKEQLLEQSLLVNFSAIAAGASIVQMGVPVTTA